MKKISLFIVAVLILAAVFFYYSSSKQGYKDKIASACRGGGKVVSQECSDLLKEYRQKFPEATSDVNSINTTEETSPNGIK